jgi:hypothetical protein
MARRKRRHHVSRRRHRVGAVNMKSALMKVAGIGAGVFAGRLITTKLGASLSPTILGAVTIVAGVMIPKYVKSDLGQGLGDGLVAVGILGELQQFGIISGLGYAPPGQNASTSTGANGYNPGMAKTVGYTGGRQIMKSTVGHLNGIPMGELQKIGALFEE